ncbi:superoxide dismutase [Faucicola atlantae]|uniref:Superoxide dismutase n=1 Tax=Faucicola atlantae TaxID=34059 RepID=A0A1B8Q9F5_9GAMM|nr:superoxide dismutase [Moraxella atlantae]OBX75396.1 superoxide dismutase [Moraxella atlantae]
MSQVTLPDLPYSKDALEPHISAETLEFHHDKHHAAYVNKLNELLPGSGLEGKELDEIIKTSAKDDSKTAIFNQAAQVWNHTFYWNSMTPNGGGEPTGELKDKINEAFGSYAKFREEFKNAAVSQFGSGWAWLVADSEGGKLSIMKTSNADTPMVHGKVAVLTCDVWEHAYYIDYRNRRPDYVDTFLDNLVNWEYANAKYHERSAGVEE